MNNRCCSNKAVLQQANPAGVANVPGVTGNPRTCGVSATVKP